MVNIKSVWSNSSAGSGLPIDLDSDPEPNDESPHKRRETRSQRQQTSASAVALVSTGTVTEEEKQKTHLGGVATATAAFVSSLFSFISDIAEVNPDVINWICNGEAFIVYDKENKELLGKYLEQYFKHNRYSSFQRQLNLYGFKKHIAGKYKGAFHHPLFHRDDNSCFHLIRRNASQSPRPRRSSSSSSHKTRPVSAKAMTSGAKKRSKRIAAAAAKKKKIEKKKKTSNSLVSTEHHLVTPTENTRRNLRSKKNAKTDAVSITHVPVKILPKMQAQEEGLKPLESYQNKHIMSSPYFFSNQLSMLCDSNLSDAQDLAAPAFVSPAVDKYNRAFVTPKAVNLDNDDENNSLYDDFFNLDKDKTLLGSSVALTDATQMKSSQETKETKADKDHLFGLIPILQNNANETSSPSFVLTPRLRSLVLPQPSKQQQQQLSFSSRSTNTNTSTTFLPSSPLITSDKKKRKREDQVDDDDEVVAAFGAKVFLESNFDFINSNSNHNIDLCSSPIQCIDNIDTLSLNTWDEEGEEMSK